MLLCGKVHSESLHIHLSLLFCVMEEKGPFLFLVELLYNLDIVFIVVVEVEVSDVEIAICQNNEDRIAIIELPEIFTVFLVVKALHIWVEPNIPTIECGVSARFQCDAMNRSLRENVSGSPTTLHGKFPKVIFLEDLLHLWSWLHSELYHLCLSVRVCSEIDHL